jgi:hypothetical protein
LVPRATCLGRALRSVLRGVAVLRKKTYAGRVRSAARGARGGARDLRSPRERARRRCAAIPGCRKFRSARTKTCETAAGARKIAQSIFRSATAGRRRNRRDSPAPTGAWNAGCSHCDKPGSLSGWFRSLLPPQSIGEVHRYQQGVVMDSTPFSPATLHRSAFRPLSTCQEAALPSATSRVAIQSP